MNHKKLWIVGPKLFMKFLLMHNGTRVKAGLEPLGKGVDEINIKDGHIWMLDGFIDDGDTMKEIELKLGSVPKWKDGKREAPRL